MSQPSLIDAAKAPTLAYNKKDWNAVRAAVTPDFVYEEVATQRKLQGIEPVLACWQGWATTCPGEATLHNAYASGNIVILELTWRGTHSGPLQTATRQIPATGKPFELRACQVLEIANGKAKMMRQYFDLASLFQQLGVSS